MFVFLFVCSMLVPMSMFLLGTRWSKHPPKDKNGLSGYRTAMSRMNDDTWAYAHKYWGKINGILGMISIAASVIILISVKGHSDFEMLVTYLVFGQIAVMTLTIIPTEIKLHKIFDKNGRRKGRGNDYGDKKDRS